MLEECFGTPFSLYIPQKSNKLCSTEDSSPPPINGVVLPSGYTATDYIESNANTFIRTSLLPSAGDSCYVDVDVFGLVEDTFSLNLDYYSMVIGHSGGQGSLACDLGYVATTLYGELTVGCSSNYYDGNLTFNNRVSVSGYGRREFYVYSGGSLVGSTFTPALSSTVDSYGAYLLLASILTSSSVKRLLLSYARLYRCVFFHPNRDIRADFIPSIEVSSGRYGMYDVVGGEFNGLVVLNFPEIDNSNFSSPKVVFPYPVASDVSVTLRVGFGTLASYITVNFSIGESVKTLGDSSVTAITSVFPASDDTYVYAI